MNNKFSLKSFIAGAIFMAVGGVTIFAVGGIKSAEFNANKVIFNGKELSLGATPMISIVKDGEQNMSNYMPVRAVLEQMGYIVDWDGEKNAVIVNDKKVEDIVKPTSPESVGKDNGSGDNSINTIDKDDINLSDYLSLEELIDILAEKDCVFGSMSEDNNGWLKILDTDGKLLLSIPKYYVYVTEGGTYIEKSYIESQSWFTAK